MDKVTLGEYRWFEKARAQELKNFEENDAIEHVVYVYNWRQYKRHRATTTFTLTCSGCGKRAFLHRGRDDRARCQDCHLKALNCVRKCT